MVEAVNAVRKCLGKDVSEGQYARALPVKKGRSVVSKVDVAKRVAEIEREADLGQLDLRPQMERLVQFIKDANQMTTGNGANEE
jgi:hypothetical protein